MRANREFASEFRPDHPHLRSERGWELCDDDAPCPHAVAARLRRHYRRVAALLAGGLVVFTTGCACCISANVPWIAGTFAVSSVFADVLFVGLCSDCVLSDIPVDDRTT